MPVRVLLINADDFGIYPAANAAIVETLECGLAGSCSLMVPAPGAGEAVEILTDRPELAFGVHLSLVTDFPALRWEPLTGGRSLLDAHGRLFTSDTVDGVVAAARIEEVEAEFRAQIELVFEAGLTPTHLDWHCLADGGRGDIFDLTLDLATEYGVAMRAWLPPARAKLQARGLPVVDNDFLDSFSLPLDGKADRYERLLRGLPEGLTEWAVHPAFAEPVNAGSAVRRSDYDFLVSARAHEIVEEEGISVIGWSTLQQQWRKVTESSSVIGE